MKIIHSMPVYYYSRKPAAMQEVIGSVDFGSLRYRCYYGDPQFKEDSLYADDLHLNLTGATLFARRVKNDFGL